jgi:hypothetical protein
MKLQIEELRTELSRRKTDRHKDRKKEDRRGRSDSRDRKKDKKHKKKSPSPPSRSSSSRRSSRSSRNSRRRRSSTTKRFLKWAPKGKNRKVSPAEERRLETEKFKTKGDLQAFAAEHPGALAANFLRQCQSKTGGGRIAETKHMRRVSTVQWQERHANLKDIRDQKEVLTLCTVIDYINDDRLAEALDVLSQRVLAIQGAKSTGGSWEKSSKLELTNEPGSSSLTGGLHKLANS